MANDKTSQVHLKIDQIDQLRKEMNEIQAMVDGWKSNMDMLALEKETAQAKLTSVEVQLRVVKEKVDKQAQLNEDLRAQLRSIVVERDALDRDHKAIKSKLENTSAEVEELVSQYKTDVEAVQARLKTNAEYVRLLSRRETLEEIYARGFNLSTEIEEAINLEAEVKKLSDRRVLGGPKAPTILATSRAPAKIKHERL
ncbi:tropomyosin-like [Nicotiana tomentosiformis]|uniref:tropomyosin-like n=1 Tax=Nicotiana tomentosiformis TaxID=4098 RepID=UPI00388C5123